jgi:hypothetical protein
MDSLEQKLIAAETALEEANAEYIRARDVWKNLPSGTSERAEAEKVKNDAERAAIRAQERVKDLETLIMEQMKLAQGKFIFPFLTLSN